MCWTAGPRLCNTGKDWEGEWVRNLRLWRYADGDVCEQNTYIIRGLKVVPLKQWDDWAQDYINRPDGQKTVECTMRTALEDVSQNDSVSAFF